MVYLTDQQSYDAQISVLQYPYGEEYILLYILYICYILTTINFNLSMDK